MRLKLLVALTAIAFAVSLVPVTTTAADSPGGKGGAQVVSPLYATTIEFTGKTSAPVTGTFHNMKRSIEVVLEGDNVGAMVKVTLQPVETPGFTYILTYLVTGSDVTLLDSKEPDGYPATKQDWRISIEGQGYSQSRSTVLPAQAVKVTLYSADDFGGEAALPKLVP